MLFSVAENQAEALITTARSQGKALTEWRWSVMDLLHVGKPRSISARASHLLRPAVASRNPAKTGSTSL